MNSLLGQKKSILQDILCFIAGCGLPFSFAPFNYWILAPILIAVLWYGWLNTSPARSAWRGFLFGLGLYGVGVSWVYISIHRFGNTSMPLAVLITFLFIMVLALFSTIQGYIVSLLFSRSVFYKLLLAFPSSWVILEWVRSWSFSGFPWLYLGYSQTDSPLSSYAAVIGVYGVSFLVAFTASLLIALFLKCKTKNKIFCFIGLIIIWLLGSILGSTQWTKPVGHLIRVSIVQGNIPQEIKWVPQSFSQTLAQYQRLTEDHWRSDLIIWPESAVPLPLPYSQEFIDYLSFRVKENQTNLILGVPIRVDNKDFYNAAMLLGTKTGSYYKRHLVPFGEYFPFKKSLRGLINFFHIPMSDFIPGSYDQKKLQIDHMPIALYICYEIAYISLVRSELPEAQLLIVLSNDAWFGDSIAPAQHLQIARMRSIETGRYLISSTNDGITGIIAPNGRVIARLPQFEAGVLVGKVQAMEGMTPWIRLGPWSIISVMFLLFFIGLVCCYRRPADI